MKHLLALLLCVPFLQSTPSTPDLAELSPRVALEGQRSLSVQSVRDGARAWRSLSLDEVLAPGARLLEARAASLECAPENPGTVVALVVEEQGRHAYRFLMDGPRAQGGERRPEGASDVPLDAGFVLCAPLFTSSGQPFRLVEVRALPRTASDTLEITFRREQGWSERPRGFEELVYRNVCLTPARPEVGAGLYDVGAGEALELGSHVD